tara:strand:+ start:3533 stop:4801 length:1269 start_codon:yes stop_codon:yes gene_type:complete
MSILKVDKLHSEDGTNSNIELDDSRNVTVKGNLSVDGTIPANKLTGALPAISGASLTGLSSSPPAGRNILINGDMRIAQRGTSSTEQGCKTTDRFYYDKGGTNETPQQEQRALTSSDTGPWAKGFRWCYKITNGNQSALDAADYIRFKYITENRDIHQSGWDYTDPNSKVTISFWVKSSVSQRFYFALRTSEGTGQHYAHPFTPAANTWTYVTHTIPGNANNVFGDNNDHGLMLQWQIAMGSLYTDDSFTDDAWGVYQTNQFKDYDGDDDNWYTTDDATWEITGVQLEAGATATDFEFKRYDDELRRCQRYFYMHADGSRHNGEMLGIMSSYSTDQWYCGVHFPVTMRSGTPGLYKVVGQNYFALMSGAGVQNLSDDVGTSAQESANGYFLHFTDDVSNTTGHAGWGYISNANARVGFDAEF